MTNLINACLHCFAHPPHSNIRPSLGRYKRQLQTRHTYVYTLANAKHFPHACCKTGKQHNHKYTRNSLRAIVHAYVCTYVHTCVHGYMQHAYTPFRTCKHSHTHIPYSHTYRHTYSLTCIRTYINAYMHACMHACIHMRSCVSTCNRT